MTQIFIVDDEPMIIEVLEAYLKKEGYQVLSANNGAIALKKIREGHPDLIVLDLMLPDITGEELCRQIRKDSNVPILMLTAKSAEEDRIHGIVIGADDYVTKPFSPREVVVRIQAILRRSMGLNQRNRFSFNQGILMVDIPRNEVRARGESIPLTPIEFKLLITMAKHPGRVYSRLDLLESVQNDNYEGYERSIDVHIKNLRKKIEKDPKNPEFILTVFGLGYKFGGDADVSDAAF
jgi:DNA-binding response OmpR family regulator